MKKIISSLAVFALFLSFFAIPGKTFAGDCNAPVEDVKDYPVKITTDVFFLKTIQGAPEDNCPKSEVLGSFPTDQVLWVLGEIETGAIINEETKEVGRWLYVQHPTTKDYGFVWSKYAIKTDIPQGEENHQEVIIEGQAGQGPQSTECEVIKDVPDFFVKTTEGLNIRNGVCNGKIISSVGTGEVVKVIGQLGTWYYIEIPNNGGKGFITADYAVKTTPPLGRENEPEVVIGPDDKAVIGQAPDPNETPTPAPDAGGTLKDIVGHPYETAIRSLESKGVVQGYPDGLFKADILINRAEFTKIVVYAKLKAEPFSSAADCFPDVSKTAWYASYVCYAKESGIVSGYEDLTFKPGDPINLVEASKILVNTFLGSDQPPGYKPDFWYQPYIEMMQKNNYIPITLTKLDQKVNRGEMAEMVWRILEKVSNKSSSQFDFKSIQTTTPPPSNGSELALCTDKNVPTSVNMNKLREAWLTWHNTEREKLGLPKLVLQEGLNYSSSQWAQENKNDGAITHTRKDGQTVSDWFKALGISFKQLSGFVFAENIGVQGYVCNEADCTDEAIAASKDLFQAFMKEEGTASTKHYDNIVQPDFKELGVGISIDPVANKLYLTTHYAQAVEAYPTTCK